MKQFTKSGRLFYGIGLIALGIDQLVPTNWRHDKNEQTIIQQTSFKQVAGNPLQHLRSCFPIFDPLIKIIS
jgi:hypothetical protein